MNKHKSNSRKTQLAYEDILRPSRYTPLEVFSSAYLASPGSAPYVDSGNAHLSTTDTASPQARCDGAHTADTLHGANASAVRGDELLHLLKKLNRISAWLDEHYPSSV